MMEKEAISPVTGAIGMSRLGYVDSLRGISALLVVFSHAFHPLTFNEYFINIGKVGVFIFFMISGFVIPYSFKKEPRCYSIFITTRFFRLYPAYWFSLLLAVVVYYLLNIPPTTTLEFFTSMPLKTLSVITFI